MNVMVADDDPEYLDVLTSNLESLGHTVSAAANGQDALELFRAGDFGVVISDWMMPLLHGPALCRAIRSLFRSSYSYIILLTALQGSERYVEGLDAGADDFMHKPFDVRELAARLRVAERTIGLHSEIRRLQGVLSICAYCKRIRDDKRGWVPVEGFFARRTELRFSHGLCPACEDEQLKLLG